MNKDEIIKMAKQAGFERLGHDEHDYVCYPDDIEDFAKLVAQHEREACAKEVENALYGQEGCGKAAKAIRARGENKGATL